MMSPIARVRLKESCNFAVASSSVAIALIPSVLQESIFLQLPKAMGRVMNVVSVQGLTFPSNAIIKSQQ